LSWLPKLHHFFGIIGNESELSLSLTNVGSTAVLPHEMIRLQASLASKHFFRQSGSATAAALGRELLFDI
jgi:hypothetical protein